MFAGKSSELLRRVSYYESQGLNVAIVKSNKDDRYSASHVVTHDGIRKECHAVPSLIAFRETLMTLYTAADVIAIDEAQFFPDLTDFCTFAADHDDKRVVLAGLDGDFLRRKFGQVLDLVPLADKVTKLTAICRFCQQEEHAQEENQNSKGTSSGNDGFNAKDNVGKSGALLVGKSTSYPAVFTLRISAESGTEQEVVGGADTYAPVCRKHYVRFSKMEKKIEKKKLS
jgi:thymidine kinase